MERGKMEMFHVRRFTQLLCCCLLISLAACSGGSNNGEQAGSPTTVSIGQTTPYNLRVPLEALNAPIVGTVPANTSIPLTVSFKTSQQITDQIDNGGYTNTTGTPTSNDQVGLDKETYQRIKSYFESLGVTVKTDDMRLDIGMNVQAGIISKALGTELVYRKLGNRKFYTPRSNQLTLPKLIVDNMVALTGLEDYSSPPKSSVSAANFVPLKQQAGGDTCGEIDPTTLNPQQVAHAYGLDSLWEQGWTGKGLTINLLEQEAFNQEDVQHYLDCVSYQGQLKVINVGTTAPKLKGDEVESLMDIEMIAGLATDININVYQSASNSWTEYRDILKRIAKDNKGSKQPSYLSISWGGSESSMSQEYADSIAATLQTLQSENITTFTASGDCGSYDSGDTSQLDVDFPASSRWNVGVGGTELQVDGNGQRTAETVWSYDKIGDVCQNNWGSGGGLSTFYSQPRWQDGSGVQNKYSNKYRQVPDISAAADNLAIFFNGQWGYASGTSAAAPITATTFALINQGLIAKTHYYAYGPAIFYAVATAQNSNAFYDVQQGHNQYYSASAGWDYPSGLGVLNAPNFLNALIKLVEQKK
jgi:subtilase family serine protease